MRLQFGMLLWMVATVALGEVPMPELFERFKKHISAKETANNDYTAANPKSSARGRYQFLKDSPSTRVWEKEAGLAGPQDWVIEEGDSLKERQRKSENQDKLLEVAYTRDYFPNLEKIKKASKGKLDDVQALSLQHYQGLDKALKYARTGEEPNDPNNIPIKDYLQGENDAMSNGVLGVSGLGAFAERLARQSKDKKKQPTPEPELRQAVAQRTEQPQPEDLSPRDQAHLGMKPVVTEATAETEEKQGKPEAVVDNLATLEKGFANLPSGTLSDAEKKQWQQQIQDVRDRMKEETGRLRKAEIAERVGHALSRIFAAMYGLRTGQDMSGVKFDKTDWNNRMKQSMALLNEELGATKEGQREAGRERSEERARQRQNLLDQLALKRERRAAEAQQAAGQRADRSLDIQEGKATATQKTKARKELAKVINDAEKRNAKLEQQVNKILSSDPDKVSKSDKARQLSVLLNTEITEDDLDRDKPGWFTGDYSWNEIKQNILSKAGQAPTTAGQYTPAQEQGITNVMRTNNIGRAEAISALKAAGKL